MHEKTTNFLDMWIFHEYLKMYRRAYSITHKSTFCEIFQITQLQICDNTRIEKDFSAYFLALNSQNKLLKKMSKNMDS